MQWVETDKNGFKSRHDKSILGDFKGRLGGCGNFDETDGLRTDSLTGDVDAHNLVLSWCAANKVKIKSADIKSACLQRIPKGGIPEGGINEGDVLAARVPIYGTRDAGRGSWWRLKEVAEDKG